MTLESAQTLYWLGFKYTSLSLVIFFFLFTVYRYKKAVDYYVLNGRLQKTEYSWFFTRRWLFSGESISKYSISEYYNNNPWVVTLDFIYATLFIALGSLIWPLSILVSSVIGYAKWARIQYRTKKEFIDKLAGTYDHDD